MTMFAETSLCVRLRGKEYSKDVIDEGTPD